MASTSSCDDAADQEGFSKEEPAPVRNRNPRTGVIWETKGRAGDTSLYCDREAEDRWLEINFDRAAYLAEDLDLGISDAVLRAKLRKAADGRIAKALLTDDGLETAKTIIAKVLETEGYDELPDETPAPADVQRALGIFLGIIERRWGKRKDDWLNHWSAISLRFAGNGYDGSGGDDVYVDHRAVPF